MKFCWPISALQMRSFPSAAKLTTNLVSSFELESTRFFPACRQFCTSHHGRSFVHFFHQLLMDDEYKGERCCLQVLDDANQQVQARLT